MGHKIRDALKKQIIITGKLTERELIEEKARSLFFSADNDYSGEITTDEFKDMLKKIFTSSELLLITEDQAKKAFEILDCDNNKSINYTEFMNYVIFEDDLMRLILMKMRLEIKYFLSKRDEYPFYDEYRRLSMQSRKTPINFSRFESEIVRFLGISTLTKAQIVYLYNILKGNKQDLLFSDLVDLLSLECADLFGDIKRCLAGFGFAKNGESEMKFRTLKYIPYSYSTNDRTIIFKLSGLFSSNSSFWYVLKNANDYDSRNEYLKDRIVDIKLSNKSNDKTLVLESIYFI